MYSYLGFLLWWNNLGKGLPIQVQGPLSQGTKRRSLWHISAFPILPLSCFTDRMLSNKKWLMRSRDKGGEGSGTPLQYSCLENPMGGGAWRAAVHGVAKHWTRLSDFTFMHWRRKWQPTPVFLPGESQGRRSLVGCRLWGHTESDTTEVTYQQQQQQE